MGIGVRVGVGVKVGVLVGVVVGEGVTVGVSVGGKVAVRVGGGVSVGVWLPWAKFATTGPVTPGSAGLGVKLLASKGGIRLKFSKILMRALFEIVGLIV